MRVVVFLPQSRKYFARERFSSFATRCIWDHPISTFGKSFAIAYGATWDMIGACVTFVEALYHRLMRPRVSPWTDERRNTSGCEYVHL